jgi:hypothetical protein
MNIEDKYKLLKEENFKLKLESEQTKEHLKKYTAHKGNKKYYDTHKEELKLKPKKPYTITPEKKKEYNQRYISKKKEEQIPVPFNK